MQAMKKLVLILLLLPFLAVKAQSFAKKQIDLNIGLGLGNTFIASGTTSTFPPVSASLDIGITDAISIGGIIGYAGATWRFTGSDYCNNGNGNGGYYTYVDEYKWRYYIFGIRGAYHFAEFIKNDKIDLYLGAMLGENYARYTWTTTDVCPKTASSYGQTSGGFIFAGYAGCRYRFTDKIGAFAELGYGLSILNLGLNIKLQ